MKLTQMEIWQKNIVLFLISQTVSLFGSSLVQYAIIWYITLKTQSGVMMTISIICGFLPMLVLSPFAGVWADRYNRKVLIMLSDSFIALATLILAVLFLAGYNAIWLLFVASAARAFGTAVQVPAINAFIPQIVPVEKLTRVNAINGSIQSMVMLLSPMASGALLAMTGIERIFFIDVSTAALAVLIILFFLPVPAHAKAADKQKTGYFRDMKEGLRYIGNHSYVKRFFVFCAAFFLLAVPVAFLTPLQVTRSFGGDVWRLTAVEVAFSLGMTLGGMVIAAWGGFKNKVHTMAFASLVIGMTTFTLGIMPNFWLYLGVMCCGGIVLPFFNTPSIVLLQEKVEESFLGRVFGVMTMISSSVMPLGMLVFGPLADMVKIEWLLMGTGLLMFIQAFFLLGNKVLVEAGKPIPPV